MRSSSTSPRTSAPKPSTEDWESLASATSPEAKSLASFAAAFVARSRVRRTWRRRRTAKSPLWSALVDPPLSHPASARGPGVRCELGASAGLTVLTVVNTLIYRSGVAHRFSLVLDRLTTPTPARAGRVLAEVVGGASVCERQGVPIVTCERSAATLADAVLDCIREVEAAGAGWRVVRVEPDELVSAAAIARRLGRTRQSVALLIAGRRGPGRFPTPALWVDGTARLWRWTEVSAWASAGLERSPELDQLAAEFLAMLNGELQARWHRERLAVLAAPHIDPGTERFAVEAAFPQLGSGRRWRGAGAELPGGPRPPGST